MMPWGKTVTHTDDPYHDCMICKPMKFRGQNWYSWRRGCLLHTHCIPWRMEEHQHHFTSFHSSRHRNITPLIINRVFSHSLCTRYSSLSLVKQITTQFALTKPFALSHTLQCLHLITYDFPLFANSILYQLFSTHTSLSRTSCPQISNLCLIIHRICC